MTCGPAVVNQALVQIMNQVYRDVLYADDNTRSQKIESGYEVIRRSSFISTRALASDERAVA